MKTPTEYPMADNIMYKVNERGEIVPFEIVPFKIDCIEPLWILVRWMALAAFLFCGMGYGAIYYEDNTTHYVERNR